MIKLKGEVWNGDKYIPVELEVTAEQYHQMFGDKPLKVSISNITGTVEKTVIVENSDAYKAEQESSMLRIVKRNRHRSVEPYEWFGPALQLEMAGPNCSCVGCKIRFRQ